MTPCRLVGFHAFILTFALLFFSPIEAGATKAIANWDVVPLQKINEPFKVGVVAFHETGVSVDFQVNGADVASVTEPTWNDRTGVYEYWFELDPANYADGPITVTATAKPKGPGNENRTLGDLNLFANANGTLTNANIVWIDADNGSDTNGNGTELSPYQSIKKGITSAGDGGTVYLKASQNYKLTSIATNNNYWTTVSGAPGLTADDVQIVTYGRDGTSTGRYGKSTIRWRNLSMYCDRNGTNYGTLFYLDSGLRVWFDDVVLYDKNGRWANSSLFNGQGGVAYLTNSLIRDLGNSGGGFQRNMVIERIGADIYRGGSNLTAINVTIRVMDKGTTGAHPDFIQFYNPNTTVENVILYNIKCYDMLAQGFFGAAGKAKDVAFVNILLEKDPPSSSFRSQLTGEWEHCLLWNVTMVDQLFTFRESADITLFDVRNCVFATFTTDNVNHPSISIDRAHTKSFSSGQSAPLGTNATTGDPMFLDESVDDYRLTPESPAYGTGILSPGVPADVDGFLYDTNAPNRGVFAKSNTDPEKKKKLKKLVNFSATAAGLKSKLTTVIADEPTKRYLVEGSSDLIDWESVTVLFADSDGLLNVQESFEIAPQRRFYRLKRIYFPDLSEQP